MSNDLVIFELYRAPGDDRPFLLDDLRNIVLSFGEIVKAALPEEIVDIDWGLIRANQGSLITEFRAILKYAHSKRDVVAAYSAPLALAVAVLQVTGVGRELPPQSAHDSDYVIILADARELNMSDLLARGSGICEELVAIGATQLVIRCPIAPPISVEPDGGFAEIVKSDSNGVYTSLNVPANLAQSLISEIKLVDGVKDVSLILRKRSYGVREFRPARLRVYFASGIDNSEIIKTIRELKRIISLRASEDLI